MAAPTWLHQLRHANSASPSPASASPSFSTAATPPTPEDPSISSAGTTRRLSVQDVHEIDSWLSRLHKLEGALPSKESLPSRPAAVSRTGSASADNITNITVSTGISSESSTPSTVAHFKRRSLALFSSGSSSSSNSHSQDIQLHLDQPVHYCRPGTSASTSTSTHLTIEGSYELSPRPSSQLEPSLRTSILGHLSLQQPDSPPPPPVLNTNRLSATTTAAAVGTIRDKNKEEETDRDHLSRTDSQSDIHEKEYHETADGSYIVLTEVRDESEGRATLPQDGSEGDHLQRGKALPAPAYVPISSREEGLLSNTQPNIPLSEDSTEYLDEDNKLESFLLESETRTSTPTQESLPLRSYDENNPTTFSNAYSTESLTDQEVLSPSISQSQSEPALHYIREQQYSNMSSESPSESFNPTATISSSHSTKSISTTSSSNPSSSAGGAGKLQPRSPISSPRSTLSFRKGKGKKRFPLQTSRGDVSNDDEEEEEEQGIDIHDEISDLHNRSLRGSGWEDLQDGAKSQGLSGTVAGSGTGSSGGPIARAKKLSKSSFASSIDSVRGSLIGSSSSNNINNNNNNNVDTALGRRVSSDSKGSTSSIPQPQQPPAPHSHSHLHFFSRVSSKHPHPAQQVAAGATTSPSSSASASSRPPKLVARDERLFSSREATRPRLTSARSASSLQLSGGGGGSDSIINVYAGRSSEASDNEKEEADDESLSVINPRRASISSTSPSYQRSKDDRRALLASSINRISLAVPPPLMRSYSYDGRMTAASMAAAVSSSSFSSTSSSSSFAGYDPSELARHIPDLKQTVLLWIPTDENTGRNTSFHPSSYASCAGTDIPRTSAGHPNQHPHQNQNHNPSAAKGLANAFFSNVPLHGRKKIVRRGSTQVLFSDVDEEQNHPSSSSSHAEQKFHRQQYHPEEKKEKEKTKSRSGKGKEKASILLPSGQWKRCEAVLKANGMLTISNGTVSLASVQLNTLHRTDIRLVDPSLLGRQRCVSLHIKNGPHIPPAYSPTTNEKRTTSPNFPLSPSAQDFFSFTSLTRSASSNSGLLDDPIRINEGEQTLFLAFPTTALQHAWIASLLCHAQSEVYPTSAASRTRVTISEETGRSDTEDESMAPQSPRARPQFTQHSSWRQGIHVDPATEYPIRMYRSVSLQVIQARCNKEHQNPSLAHSLAALAMSSLPSTPANPDAVQVQKRSGSIASILTASDAASSIDSQSHLSSSQLETGTGAMPPHLKMALLANQSGVPPGRKSDSNSKESKKEESVVMFCEIWQDGEILGRTGIRHLGAKAIWEEVFHFSNLGPYTHSLDLHVFTIRKHHLQSMGKVVLPLPTIQRNKPIEGWFELHPPEHILRKGHLETLGEINLRVMVKEDISLPFQAYSKLGSALAEDTDSAAILSLLDSHQIELDLFAQILLRIDTAHRRVLHRIMSLCEQEVQRNDSLATLFRGNTLLTKTVEMHMRLLGSDYLDNTVGQVLRRLCESRVGIEIDPSRLDPKDSLEDNVKALETWCEAIWSSIYNSRHSCPIEVRRVLRKVRQIVDQHCAIEQERGRHTEDERSRARFTSVSAFISLRFFCPAILRPNLFRLCPSHPPDAKTSRTLTLIAKVLMGMANMQTFGSKEPWMAAMNPFLQRNSSSYQDFITYLCSKEEGAKGDWTEKDFEPYKIPILQRMTLTPDIVREGVPELPFLIDLPKEYAAFSAVVATADPVAPHHRPDTSTEEARLEESPHENLLILCQVLHSQTRSRVRALARTGDLSAPGSEHTRRLFARTEQVRLSTRTRGSTISKVTSTPSPDRTAILSKSSPAGSAEGENRSALFASSPASTHSGGTRLADLSASTSPSMDSSSESQLSSSPNRPKRRSYTVSASPSLTTRSDVSPTLVRSTSSRPLPEPPVDEEDILDIRNPSCSPSSPTQPIKETNPRRLTIIAPRPLVLDSRDKQENPPIPGMKTPRAPTFTQEQRENLRELQEAFLNTAYDNPASSIGDMPSPRADPPISSPVVVPVPPPKRKLFRKK